jgi:peptidoglycan L-alanyl-D-glutamate endopeptidase CwlK
MRHNLPTDAITLKRIALLHPKVRTEALLIYQESVEALASGGSSVRYTYTLRDLKEQSYLYALGRTIRNPNGYHPTKKPLGNIVTNAKAGQSIHNYGLAFDICLLVDKDGNGVFDEVSWNMNLDLDFDKIFDWQEVVRVAKKYGWEWGGVWRKFKDYPHFQKDFNLDWKQLQKMVEEGEVDKDGYVLIN